jgi:mRNA interferase MazF
MKLARGAIHWVGFPKANGREQAGRRPAVIVQDEAVAGFLPVVLAVPVTGSVAAARFAGTVVIDPTPENGLSARSVALVFQLRAVDRLRIEERVGVVSEEVLGELFTALDHLLGRNRP